MSIRRMHFTFQDSTRFFSVLTARTLKTAQERGAPPTYKVPDNHKAPLSDTVEQTDNY